MKSMNAIFLMACLLAACASEQQGEPSAVTVTLQGPARAYLYFSTPFSAEVESASPVYSIAWDFDADGTVDTLGADLYELRHALQKRYWSYGSDESDAEYLQKVCPVRVRAVTMDQGVAYDTLLVPCFDPTATYPQSPPLPHVDAEGRLLFTPAWFWPDAPAEIAAQLRIGIAYDAQALKPDTILAWGDTLRLPPDGDQVELYAQVENWSVHGNGFRPLTYERHRQEWFATVRPTGSNDLAYTWLAHPIEGYLALSDYTCPIGYTPAAYADIAGIDFPVPLLKEWLRQGLMDSTDRLYLPSSTRPAAPCADVAAAQRTYYHTEDFQACPDTVWFFCRSLVSLPRILLTL